MPRNHVCGCVLIPEKITEMLPTKIPKSTRFWGRPNRFRVDLDRFPASKRDGTVGKSRTNVGDAPLQRRAPGDVWIPTGAAEGAATPIPNCIEASSTPYSLEL